MSYAIIGFGKIGHALAKAFARNGIEVSVATTRDPESFATDAAAIGQVDGLCMRAERTGDT
jgi:8-hydroxy-5-deazaflavin:NADPH oxidoreductase